MLQLLTIRMPDGQAAAAWMVLTGHGRCSSLPWWCQVSECKTALLDGLKEQNIRQVRGGRQFESR